MNIYQSVENYLTTVLTEFKAEAKRVHLTVEQGSFLDPRDMQMLTEANARGEAAQTIKNVIELHLTHVIAHAKAGGKTEEEAKKEALPRIIRAVQNSMDTKLSNGSTHIASIVVFNNVLSALRNEVDGV